MDYYSNFVMKCLQSGQIVEWTQLTTRGSFLLRLAWLRYSFCCIVYIHQTTYSYIKLPSVYTFCVKVHWPFLTRPCESHDVMWYTGLLTMSHCFNLICLSLIPANIRKVLTLSCRYLHGEEWLRAFKILICNILHKWVLWCPFK